MPTRIQVPNSNNASAADAGASTMEAMTNSATGARRTAAAKKSTLPAADSDTMAKIDAFLLSRCKPQYNNAAATATATATAVEAAAEDNGPPVLVPRQPIAKAGAASGITDTATTIPRQPYNANRTTALRCAPANSASVVGGNNNKHTVTSHEPVAKPAPARHAGWDNYFSQLKDFAKAHGHVNVPPGHILHSWIEQKKVHAKCLLLPPHQIRALKKIGLSYFTDEMAFESGAQEVIYDSWVAAAHQPKARATSNKNMEPSRRSARLNKTPEKAEEKKVEDETCSTKKALTEDEHMVEESTSSTKKTFTEDTHRSEAASAREERSKRRQSRFLGELPPPTKKQKLAPKKESYTENDIQSAAQSNNAKLLNQPCTIMDGNLTTGFITLTLPPPPTKLGIILEDNLIFGYPEVKSVKETSPIAIQIPLNFRTDCLITSIESNDFLGDGCIVPESARHCADLFDLARTGGGGGSLVSEEVQVVVNFAKNPMSLYFPKEDDNPDNRSCSEPASAAEERKQRKEPNLAAPPAATSASSQKGNNKQLHQKHYPKLCNGPCKTNKFEDEFSVTQWKGPPEKDRICVECQKKKPQPVPPNSSKSSQKSNSSCPLGKERICTDCSVGKTEDKYPMSQWLAPCQQVCSDCMNARGQLFKQLAMEDYQAMHHGRSHQVPFYGAPSQMLAQPIAVNYNNSSWYHPYPGAPPQLARPTAITNGKSSWYHPPPQHARPIAITTNNSSSLPPIANNDKNSIEEVTKSKQLSEHSQRPKLCSGPCEKYKFKHDYSFTQWKTKDRVCLQCQQQGPQWKQCSGPCGLKRPRDGYSGRQWHKSKARDRVCLKCTKTKELEQERFKTLFDAVCTQHEHQKRYPKQCSGPCGMKKFEAEYSGTQWKGPSEKERICVECQKMLSKVIPQKEPRANGGTV